MLEKAQRYGIRYIDLKLDFAFKCVNDRDDGIMLTDSLHYVTIELPQFNKKLNELDSTLDRLLYLFRYLGTMEEIPNELIGKKWMIYLN